MFASRAYIQTLLQEATNIGAILSLEADFGWEGANCHLCWGFEEEGRSLLLIRICWFVCLFA